MDNNNLSSHVFSHIVLLVSSFSFIVFLFAVVDEEKDSKMAFEIDDYKLSSLQNNVDCLVTINDLIKSLGIYNCKML